MINKIKYFFLSVLLSSWSSFVWAQAPQPNYTLTTNETGAAKSYVAREYVSLKPGFAYSASGGGSFNAKIDQTLIFPPTANTYATPNGTITTDPTQGAVVGSIPGQFGVSSTGGANYTIPIECPAGVNGMQPNISLTYNSQGGSGIAGWGWNISGISMISRSAKSYYYDGEKSGIIWDNTSPFSLDGQRLIETQRWVTGAVIDSIEYDTEAKSGNRIVGCQIQSWGPLFFKVYTKSGQLLQFGNPTNIASYYPLLGDLLSTSFRNLSWAIVSIKDNNGNYVNYDYKTESMQVPNRTHYRQTSLDKISYGGNSLAGTSANQIIQFVYNTKNVANLTDNYIDGIENYSNIILDAVKVISNGTELRKYTTAYDVVDGKSHLKSFSLSNDKNEHLNSLGFEWNDNTYQYSNQGIVTYELDKSPLINRFRFTDGYNHAFQILSGGKMWGDIDGDGDLDAVIRYKMTKSTYNGWWADHIGGNPYTYTYKYVWVVYRNDGGTFKYVYDEEFDLERSPYFIFLDKDNDGKEELYWGKSYETWGATGQNGKYSLDCYKYKNNVFSNDITASIYLPDRWDNATNKSSISILPADFLGKGDPQLMALTTINNVTSPLGFSEINCSFKNIIQCSDRSDMYVSDFNGNGKSELVYVHDDLKIYEFQKNSSNNQELKLIYTYPGIGHFDDVYPLDFNGDGNTDFLVRKYPYSTWKFLRSTGTELIEVDMNNTLTATSDVKIVDVNKDGKSDILFIDYDFVNNVSQATNFKLLVSNGIDFEQKISQKYTGSTPFSTFHAMGRFNNDKYDDVLLDNQYSDVLIGISNNIKFDKVNRFKDSFQNSTKVEYDLFQSNQVKAFENGIDGDTDSKRNVTASNYGSWDIVNWVSTTSENNIITGMVKYDFGNAYIHKKGKGLLGFLNTTVTDYFTGIQKKSQNQLNSTYYFLYPTSDTTKLVDDAKNMSVETMNYYPIESIGKLYNFYLKSRNSNNILDNLSSSIEYLSYDNWGNLKSTKTTRGDIIETKAINYVRRGAWCDNVVNDVTTIKTQNNGSCTRVTNYEYDGKGNLTKKTEDPTDENKLVTEYKDFDIFGHPQTTEITANNKTRTVSVAYTPSGRFIASKTNPLKETTTYNWDETRSLLNYEIDYRNNKTTYKYDNWGQLVETQYPTGIRKAQVTQWASAGSPVGSKYYNYTEISGNAPTTVWYDGLNRELVTETYGLNKKKVSVFTEYNSDGKKFRVSEPTFNTTAETWAATYYYDDPYKRLSSVVTPMGETSTKYSGRTTSVTSPEGTQITTLNSSGQLLSSNVNGKVVSYAYDCKATGETMTSTPESGQAITVENNLQGKRVKLIDPDGGTVESKYNGFGELLWEQQKIHDKDQYVRTTNTYDDNNGLLLNINRNGEVTTYNYDPQYKSRGNSITKPGNTQTFDFDAFDRVRNIKEEIGSHVYNTTKEFDGLGRIKKEIYPSGYFTTNTYDEYSNLIEVKDNANRSIWKAIDENARGQLTNISKGGKVTTNVFDTRGLPTSISASGVVNVTYLFNEKGNLEYRTDEITHQKEKFKYDGLNRLTNWDIYKDNSSTASKENSISYNSTTGNIDKKSDLGNFDMKYGVVNNEATVNQNPGPHALTSIGGIPPDNFPSANLNVTYTDFKKIASLKEGSKEYYLSYGVDDQRRKSEYYVGGALQQTRYYLGNYEEEIDATGNVRKIHYLSGGALMVNTGGVETLYYGYADYQGSLIALTDVNGNIVEKYAYDPWGARRNPADWTQKDVRTSWITNRGYTGHEHLDAFAIINMNGRVYDPLTAMFFSPDPYVQAPGDWLNYNRYGYCYGNPFRYTDPSGEFIQIIVGAIVGGVINWAAHGCQFNVNGLAAFGIGAVGGAIAGATFGASIAAAGAAGAVGYGGFLAGACAGGASYAASTSFTSIGNAAYFHDPLPTLGQLTTGLAFSMVTAGVINGFTDPNYNFIGTKVTPIKLDPLPIPTVGLKTSGTSVASNLDDDIANLSSGISADVNTATSEALPMQGKVMNTVKGPDGKVNFVFKDGVQYTKSNLALGREMHAEYKLSEHAPELGRFKEFTGIKGIRPDFVDFNNKTIYELKPYNLRSIQLGTKQLNNYKLLFEQNYGGAWKTVLEHY